MPLRRVAALGAVILVVTALSGCARIMGSYDIAPSGLQRDEERLRRMLSTGRSADAWQHVQKDAPDDEVLRALYAGVVAYHAGDFQRSADILDAAGVLADDRVTKSISRSALSLVSNDRVLPYEPSHTERLLIPYYAALARLRGGDIQGAAVEARRLSLLLSQRADSDVPVEPSLAATLRYFAAGVLEAAGDREYGDVAYRNALAADSTLPAVHPASPDSGDVLVVLEQGFVAHRVEEGLAVMLHPVEVRALSGEGDDRVLAAGLVAARVLEYAGTDGRRHAYARGGTLHVPAPQYSPLQERQDRSRECPAEATPVADNGGSTRTRRRTAECEQDDDDDGLPYLLKVAWPVYRADDRPARASLLVGADTLALHNPASVSAGVLRDFEAERPLVVARTLVRGAAKLALTKGAERKLEERNEAAARLVGLLGNVGNVLLERADTRSWHLLPATISVQRVRLPVGSHTLALHSAGSSASATVTVSPAGMTVLPLRVW